MRNTDLIFLKVKAKSLAAEARIIRQDEKKYRGTFRYEQLYRHRIDVVRRVARETHLALSFLHDKEIMAVEKTYDRYDWMHLPNWESVKKMVDKYGVKRAYFDTLEDYQLAKKQQDEEFKNFSERKPRAAVVRENALVV